MISEADLSVQLITVTRSQPRPVFALLTLVLNCDHTLVLRQFLIEKGRYYYTHSVSSEVIFVCVCLQKGAPVMLPDTAVHQQCLLLPTAGTSHGEVGMAPAQPMVKTCWT